jgi:hypothetical protein
MESANEAKFVEKCLSGMLMQDSNVNSTKI